MYLGAENGSAWGRPQISASFYLPDKDRNITLIYPGRQAKANPAVVSTIKALKPKSPVEISAESYIGKQCLLSLRELPVREGEDKPCVYVYDGTKTGRGGVKGATLTKYFRSQTLPLAKQSLDGSDLDKRTDELKPGDLVYAEVDFEDGRQVITLLKPYRPPLKGEVVKYTPPKAGQESATVEIKTDSGTTTYTLSTKTIGTRKVVSPKLRMACEKLRPGQSVELHADDTNDKTLFAIWPNRDAVKDVAGEARKKTEVAAGEKE